MLPDHPGQLGGPAAHAPPALLIVMLLAVVVEAVWRVAVSRRGYDRAGAAASVGVGVGNLVFGGLCALALAGVFALAWRMAPIRWPLDDWRTWATGFLVVEFAYYWFHRWSHEVRWLWANHAVHHSATEMTFLSAIRLGWTNLPSGGWAIYLPLVLAGFHPSLVVGLLAANLRYQFFLHTEAVGRLGPLEWILNTPAHHRIHHARNDEYLDRNYGGVLIVFDRLFGTFAAERPGEPIRYGLVHPETSGSPVRLALGEWGRLLRDIARAKSVRAAFSAAFGRPA